MTPDECVLALEKPLRELKELHGWSRGDIEDLLRDALDDVYEDTDDD